jgi:hypothetical protein
MVTAQQPTASVLPKGHASSGESQAPAGGAAQPLLRRLTLAYGASLLVAALVTFASGLGLTWGAGDVYGGSSSVLVSRGADVANLLLGATPAHHDVGSPSGCCGPQHIGAGQVGRRYQFRGASY